MLRLNDDKYIKTILNEKFMKYNQILNEEKSQLVQKVVAHWISHTKGQPVTVNDLVGFLQSDNIQRVLPYNAEITDEIINNAAEKSASAGFGDEQPAAPGDIQLDPDTKKAYITKIQNVVGNLSDEEKQSLSRMLR